MNSQGCGGLEVSDTRCFAAIFLLDKSCEAVAWDEHRS